MIKIEYSIETEKGRDGQSSKCLIQTEEDDSGKTKAILMKICNGNDQGTSGEKMESVSGKIIKGVLKIQGGAKITIKKDPKHSLILVSITPR